MAAIHQVLAEDDENSDNYGVHRIFLALRNNKGRTESYSTVCRVCRKNSIIQKKRRNPNSLTKADRKAQKSENIIQQDFTAEKPNEKWLSDITEVPCADERLYVAPVFDCYDGAIVGLAIDNHMRKELCIQSFEQACRRQNAYGMIFHSDRGRQYTSYDFRTSLASYGAIQSMSGTGRYYDNARMESFFATLKKEKLYRIKTKNLTMETVKSIIWRYIEGYYNHRRIYTTNNGYPPLVFRNIYHQQHSSAA